MLRSLVGKFTFLRLQPSALQAQIKGFSDEVRQSTTRQLDSIEKSFNQVILIGRVGNNPETRGTEQNPVVTFSLATNTFYNKNEELVQQAEWHRVAVFKPTLRERILRYLTKGSRVMVNGRITYFERKDPSNENILIKNASIVAEDIMFLSKSSNS